MIHHFRHGVESGGTNKMPTETLRPNANGSYQQWDYTIISDWQGLQDDSDSGYIGATADNLRASYYLDDLTASASANSITSVQYKCRLRANTGGQVKAALYDGSNWTVYGTDTPDTANWGNFTHNAATAPDGGPWTVTKVNSVQIGSESTAVVVQVQCTEYWLIVDYSPAGGGLFVWLSWIPPLFAVGNLFGANLFHDVGFKLWAHHYLLSKLGQAPSLCNDFEFAGLIDHMKLPAYCFLGRYA